MRQRLAAKLSVENGGIVSRAMRDAGYSPQTAKVPQKLTESKSWDELMEEFLPESKLAAVHQQQLDAEKMQVVGGVAQYEPDNDARIKAMDLAYKLRGRYAPEQITMTKRKYADLTNEELAALKIKLKNHLLKK